MINWSCGKHEVSYPFIWFVISVNLTFSKLCKMFVFSISYLNFIDKVVDEKDLRNKDFWQSNWICHYTICNNTMGVLHGIGHGDTHLLDKCILCFFLPQWFCHSSVEGYVVVSSYLFIALQTQFVLLKIYLLSQNVYPYFVNYVLNFQTVYLV